MNICTGSTSVMKPRVTTDSDPFAFLRHDSAVREAVYLLERITETGSLHKAATSLGLDEDLAWDCVVAANNLSDIPLLSLSADGLTPTLQGRQFLDPEENLTSAFQCFLDTSAGGAFDQFHLRHQFLRRLVARTSARNQIFCHVRSVRRERVNAVVNLDIGGGDLLSAHITAQSVVRLGLLGGSTCHALIDPGWVEVQPGTQTGQNGQHNCLNGKVVRCLDDPVDAEVAIELNGGRIIIASMTRAEMAEKAILVGQPAYAVIQTSQIILAVEAPPESSSENHRGDKS